MLADHSGSSRNQPFSSPSFSLLPSNSITGERLSSVIEGCRFVAIRSGKEFEGEYIDLLQELYKRPVIAIGMLPPERKIENHIDVGSSSDSNNWSTTFKWLDTKNPKSVLFVGFGSEYKMPLEQVHELAYGLELSGQDFIWILRKPKGLDDDDNDDDDNGGGGGTKLLPPNCVLDKGLVCTGWGPQSEILAHPSIGGCLFHSGWGSIIESLGFGHPLILMPMVADQGLCAKLLLEKGLGYEVPRNEDGSFTRDMVAESVKMVIGSQTMREKASQVSWVFSDQKVEDSYITSFVSYLQRFKRGLEFME